MNKKVIIASTIGLLAITSMIVGATTLAGNTPSTGHKLGLGTGGNMGKICNCGSHMGAEKNFGSGDIHGSKMQQFATTGDAEAYYTAVTTAIQNNDYTTYVAVHTTYAINTYMTKAEFTQRVSEIKKQDAIKSALLEGDYPTWKSLNSGNAILDTITTQAKFMILQEIATYQAKIETLATQLGIDGGKNRGIAMGMHERNPNTGMLRGMGERSK